MTVDVKEFERIKQKCKRLQSEVDKAQGALDETMKTIENEFDCGSLQQAIKFGKELKLDAEEAEEEYQSSLEEFQKEWEDKV